MRTFPVGITGRQGAEFERPGAMVWCIGPQDPGPVHDWVTESWTNARCGTIVVIEAPQDASVGAVDGPLIRALHALGWQGSPGVWRCPRHA